MAPLKMRSAFGTIAALWLATAGREASAGAGFKPVPTDTGAIPEGGVRRSGWVEKDHPANSQRCHIVMVDGTSCCWMETKHEVHTIKSASYYRWACAMSEEGESCDHIAHRLVYHDQPEYVHSCSAETRHFVIYRIQMTIEKNGTIPDFTEDTLPKIDVAVKRAVINMLGLSIGSVAVSEGAKAVATVHEGSKGCQVSVHFVTDPQVVAARNAAERTDDSEALRMWSAKIEKTQEALESPNALNDTFALAAAINAELARKPEFEEAKLAWLKVNTGAGKHTQVHHEGSMSAAQSSCGVSLALLHAVLALAVSGFAASI